MKKILMSLFISMITISSLWAESNITIEQVRWEKEKDLMSLNENMKADLSIQQLEERLETDPLALGGLLDIPTPDTQVTCFVFECGNSFKIDF